MLICRDISYEKAEDGNKRKFQISNAKYQTNEKTRGHELESSAIIAPHHEMKFKKFILVLTQSTDQGIVSEVVQLCKKLKSKLFVLFIIEIHKISRLARLTHQNIDTIKKKVEEEGWQLLYLVEDEAVNSGVWTSLHLEYGSMTNVLKKYVNAYDINVILIKKKDETKKVFVSAQIPVIGL